MDYQQAMECEVTRKEAQREIELHGISFEEFLIDCGDCESYKGSKVLNWLGY